MTDDANQFTITLRDLYNKMEAGGKETAEKLSTINTTLARLEPALERSSDHEARIRVLERFRYTLMGMAVLLGTLAGALGDVIANAIRGH